MENVILTQKEWMELIKRCLAYLHQNNPSSKVLFREQRYVLPNNFTQTPTHLCYAYKGVFLPSGNLDGMVWKPSQGAKPNGKGLYKRYFYCNKDNVKINRQVIWLTEDENWCFVDYRHNLKGKVRLQDIQTPEGFDFKALLKLAWDPPVRESLSSSIPLFSASKKRKEREFSNDDTSYVQSSSIPLSSPSNNTSIGLNSYEKAMMSSSISNDNSLLHSLDSNFLAPLISPSNFGFNSSPPPFSECLDYDSFLNLPNVAPPSPIKLETTTVTSFEQFSEPSDKLFPSSPSTSSELDSFEFDSPSNPAFVSPLPFQEKFLPSSISFHSPLTISSVESSLFSGLQGSDKEDSSPQPNKKPRLNGPSFFSSPLEYLLDMISNKISLQILFKRSFFRRFEEETTQDYNHFLERVKHEPICVDLSEFPAAIVKNFFGWVAEIFFHLRQDQLPPLYCVVCGQTEGKHDELAHGVFYSQLDQTLVSTIRDKSMTVPELCKVLITFLLKNPESHQHISAFITQYLHCPFCSCKKGIHRNDRHEKWQLLFHIDPNHHTSVAPEPSNNVYESVKATFSWLMGYVPVSIPPFLLSFHYVKNLQSFLDCLVTLWQTIRL